MIRNRFECVALVVAALALVCGSTVAKAQTGHFARPHAVAVHDGDVIATSVKTDSVSIIYDGNSTPTYFDIGAPSWGVCFADSLAYVTRPGTTAIAVVNLVSADSTQYITVPEGCTEIIASADGETLYVANVGRSIATTEAGMWRHSIVVVDLTAGGNYTEFETERQPRALALSPDGDRLFVGNVQGALGQSGMDSTYVDASNGFRSTHDGGSILVHDLVTTVGDVLYRFAVGSPVRGIAALPDSVYSPLSYSGDYRVYFTNVGFGVQSEAPAHGGKLIPNVISSILMSSSHEPESRQDTVFKHLSTYDPPDPLTNAGLPAVLPEKLIAIADESRSGYAASLWVTNSASGTVSRAWIDSDGSIATGQSSESLSIPAVSAVEDDGSFAYTFGNVPTTYPVIDPADHVRTDSAGISTNQNRFRSRPRGIAFDASDTTVVVCTTSFGDVVRFSAAADTFQGLTPDATVSVGATITGWNDSSEGEGSFFTFGEGFDFRETRVVNREDPVDNLSCGTCHLDGHLDGKVRLTVRVSDNMPSGAQQSTMVTAVPSALDATGSEWLFFEGLKTVVDGGISGCSYCASAFFFEDTVEFVPTSPGSPFADGSDLSSAAEEGLAWMDDMNCTRCHSGSDEEFLRTNDGDVPDDDGPLPGADRLMNDPTQVFISDIGGSITLFDHNSLRNMTVVGSRISGSGTLDPAADVHIPGVNTPPLAGAWDNRPYFHDGRYRTLDEVLQHTWISVDLGMRAAGVWDTIGVPDNLFDDRTKPITDSSLGRLKVDGQTSALTLDGTPVTVKNFMTHAHADPDSSGTTWISVKDYLTSNGAYEDVLEAIRSFSSQVDPFSSQVAAVDTLRATVTDGIEVLVEWTTPEVMVSRYTITNDQTSDTKSGWTGPGTSHIAVDTMDIGVEATWKAVVSTSYNGKVATDSVTWSTAPQFVNLSASTGALTVAAGKTVAASIPLDYTDDGYEDLLVSYSDDYAMLFENDGGQSEAATFTDRRLLHLHDGTIQSTHGAASADVNGDGFVDLFIAGSTDNYLLAGDGADFDSEDSSHDISDLMGDTESMDAIGASFGDYNGDSWPDLFVMSASTGTGDVLLENALGDSLVDVTSAADLHTGLKGSTATAWADLDRDGDTDLIVGWGGAVGTSGEWTRYYLNNGESSGQVTFDDVAGASTGPRLPRTGHVEDVELGDISGDGDLDLLLALDDASASNTLVGWINDGDGAFTVVADTALGLSSTEALTDLELADLNANGVLDVIAVPDGGGSIEVFSGYGEESDREYREGTDALALGTDEAHGVVAADFNRDTDVDLFLMRPVLNSNEAFFWANALVDSISDTGEEPAFTVTLRANSATTDSSTTVSGVTVTSRVTTGEGRILYSTQVVDGGSGGGGQGADRLIFGLADADAAQVTVLWPDGYEEVVDVADSTEGFPHIVLNHDWDPDVIASSITETYTAGTGNVTWVFTWKTRDFCDGAEVEVTTESTSSGCLGPLGMSQSKTLSSGDSGVTWTQTQSGDDWLHTLSWTTSCSARCDYDYNVYSVVGSTAYAGPQRTLKITVCPVPFP